MLVIINFTPVMLLRCFINTKSIVHDKSSFISHFINGKLRNLQKLLRYLSGIETAAIKVGTASCASRFAPRRCPGCGGISDVFPTILICRLTYYHQHHQFCLYNNSINFVMSWNNFNYILTDYTSA